MIKRPKIIALATAPLLVGAAFWFSQFWFLIGFVLILPFYAIENLSRPKSLAAFSFFTFLSGLAMAYPLLRIRSIQSLIPDQNTSLTLLGIIVVWVFFLAFLGAVFLFVSFSLFKKPWKRILIMPPLWVIFEILKTKLSFDLQWLFLGEPLIEFPPLAVYARLGGTYFLSFMVMAFNVSFYEGLKFFFKTDYLKRILSLSTLAVGIGILAGVGFFYSPEQSAYTKELRIALVQPGSIFGTPTWEYYKVLHKNTRSILEKNPIPKTDLVIFPGNYFSSNTRPEIRKKITSELAQFLPASTSILTGFNLVENSRLYQANVLYLGEGETQFAFKRHLLPFSEYVPRFLRKIYSMPPLVPIYASGENNLISLPDRTIAGVISCSEAFVVEVAREAVRKGAKILIITGSNDDFLGGTAFAEALRAARFRAIENNVYVITAFKSGISAVIDPNGRVLKQLGQKEEGLLAGQILVAN